ncbi:MAG: hypothetical protein SFY68_07410 [Candidatus Sumerlaeia bacterium]|nr:hypothetical protein [Candidatus Sumerlaeia bacterium]
MVLRRWLGGLVCATLCGFILVGCAKEDWRGLPPEEIPSLVKEEFEIRPGMNRTQVEEVLGFPSEIGVTKSGETLAQYTWGASVRSVEYTADDVVIVAYP